MTIGIIEDDSLLNQALEIALQNAGYYTISAHTRKPVAPQFPISSLFLSNPIPQSEYILNISLPFSIRFYFPAQPIDRDTDCIVHYKLSVHTPDCLQNVFGLEYRIGEKER